MAPDCLFCKIISGAIPAHRVFEDDSTFAFLDIRPLAVGHTLVVPKTHAARFEDLDAESAGRLWRAVHKIVPSLLKATGAVASTLAVNNGKEAGQEVPHVHVHVVPRHPGDGGGPIHALDWKRPAVTSEELAALVARLRTAKP